MFEQREKFDFALVTCYNDADTVHILKNVYKYKRRVSK